MASTPAASTEKTYLKSMRAYLTELKKLGEVIEVDREVNWSLEVGAIIRRVYETQSPAALFNRIKGIERSFRIFGAPAGVSRQPGLYLSRTALSLGLDPRASARDIVESLVVPPDWNSCFREIEVRRGHSEDHRFERGHRCGQHSGTCLGVCYALPSDQRRHSLQF
ncbi:MAG TPA: hypothetical protein VFO39_15185 [Candidatus Sulfotelmatobacter sp.]|nr:hypothetical protein [Candidatus Sulfotelmatobacter sp.]